MKGRRGSGTAKVYCVILAQQLGNVKQKHQRLGLPEDETQHIDFCSYGNLKCGSGRKWEIGNALLPPLQLEAKFRITGGAIGMRHGLGGQIGFAGLSPSPRASDPIAATTLYGHWLILPLKIIGVVMERL